MEWKLTDQEVSELSVKGGNVVEAQKAKKEAYLKRHNESRASSYTKGEWYWEYNDQMHHNLRAKSTHPSGCEEDKHILFVAPDFLGEDSLINEADAQLIASAPYLYEALKEAKYYIEKQTIIRPQECGDAMVIIQKALAKALDKG